MPQSLAQEIKRLKESKIVQRDAKRNEFQIIKQCPQQKLQIEKPIFKKYSSQSILLNYDSSKIFNGIFFCFPIIDITLTGKRIEFLTRSIHQSGGQVCKFNNLRIIQPIDYLLCSAKTNISNVRRQIMDKINYRQILDVNYIQDVIRYSQFQNIDVKDYVLDSAKQTQQDIEIRTCKKFGSGRKKIKFNENNFMLRKEEKQQDIEQKIKINEHNKQIDVSGSMNKFICAELMKLQKIYEAERDVGRRIAYLKAVSAIRTLDYEIKDDKDIDQIKGIGKKIQQKIKELICTGKLEKLQQKQKSEQNIVCTTLSQIWGIGPSKALDLFSKGIRNLQDLKAQPQLLTKNQKLGLRYHDDFGQRIVRDKVQRMFNYVRKIFWSLVGSQSLHEIQVCGSYRRGKQSCGDIDIIIAQKYGNYQKTLLLDLVVQLEKQNFLTDHLSFPKPNEDKNSQNYMGVCLFQNHVHHRIDIKYYPIDQYAFALLYFTGSGMFNRNMRLRATAMGLQLSDHGAVPRKDPKNGLMYTKKLPICRTEQDIFKFMGMKYLTPSQRDL